MGNPYAQEPLPSDWDVRPTYPVHAVPYFLAPLWDAKFAEQSAARQSRERKRKAVSMSTDAKAGVVPKELKQKLKRSRGAKGLLQDLEEQVRPFVRQWEDSKRRLEEEAVIEPDSEDDEIVFVGRAGQMYETQSPRHSENGLRREKLVFDSLETDHGASFGYCLALRG